MDFRMDVKSLSELLKGTIDPTVRNYPNIKLVISDLFKTIQENFQHFSQVRNEAEKKLAEVHKIIGFGPVLLQVSLLPY